ncbi:hemolysin III [Ruminococcaceae bacterium YRB3002]|nr:hemolysin III [Ruminococcaceae bacterium YRB3002]
MAKNAKHWKTFVASDEDKKLKAATGVDPLEEGLKDMGWFANSKRIVAKGLKRTQETFGEEIGNSITAGVMALFLLCILPVAAIKSYISTPVIDGGRGASGVMVALSVSAFVITLFLSLLFSTIFHFMKHGTPQKRVMNKMNRIIVYYAILGAYSPICACLLPVVSGSVIWALQAACAVAGTLVTAITYPQSKTGNVISKLIYVIMGWMILVEIKIFFDATTPLCFWLIVSGAIMYSVGLWFNFGKKFKFSHMVWHLFVLGASVLHVLGFVFFFAY